MAINFENCKNDTAKANLVRKELANIIFQSAVVEFGEENVRLLDKQIEVGENATKVPKNTVCIKTGETVNKNGIDVDIVATITAEVKNFVENTNKSGKTNYAICWDDILFGIELANDDSDKK